jgi:hypothetical protein
MDFIIYWIGVIIGSLLVIYAVLYLLYKWLDLQVDPAKPKLTMPVLRPVTIPTKNQKTLLHKLVAFIFEVRKWEVVENWQYTLKDEQGKVKAELIIPKGFCFDGASIPRPLWAILNPIGLLLIPGLLHDYAYKYNQIWQVTNGQVIAYEKDAGKDFWDTLFKQVGKEVNGFFLINVIAWLAVAAGGDGAWKGHRAAKSKLVKPVLSS